MRALPEDLVGKTLKTLGIDAWKLSDSGRGIEVWSLCPNPDHDDHSPSWSINADTGLHSCFSCGYKGNLYTLVRDIKGLATAQGFWTGYHDQGYPAPEGFLVDRNLAPAPADPAALEVLPESRLALFEDVPTDVMEARRLQRFALDYYGVRWNPENSAWVLPFRDPISKGLIGYQEKYTHEKGFRNYPPRSKKSSTFFGYVEAQDIPRIVVVESPLDAVRLFGLGFPAIASAGSHLSPEQLELLGGFEFVLFAFDNDGSGRKERDRLRRMMLGFRYSTLRYLETSPKDVGEMSDAMIDFLLVASGF